MEVIEHLLTLEGRQALLPNVYFARPQNTFRRGRWNFQIDVSSGRKKILSSLLRLQNPPENVNNEVFSQHIDQQLAL
jgi:hypothetical protein